MITTGIGGPRAGQPGFAGRTKGMAPVHIALMALAAIVFTAVPGVAGQQPSAVRIMERNYLVNRTSDKVVDITMEMISGSGRKRVRRLTSAAVLSLDGVNEKRMLRFLYPPDIRGTGFLVMEQSPRDDLMWLYLPTLRKSRRKQAGDKKDSFMGTEFSYGDITGPKVSEFTYNLEGTQPVDGIDCYVIKAVPATDEIRNNYGYSMRTDYIRTDIFTRRKAVFYDLKGRLLKTMTGTSPFQADKAGQKWFLEKRVMKNHQNKRSTILTMENIRVNLGLNENDFSVRNLEDAP